MKRKSLYVFLVAGIFFMLLANEYIKSMYDVNLMQYIRYSQGITEEEKNWLKVHGPIVYGADKSSPPLRYVDEETGQYKGVVVDYINILSIELGTEIKFTPQVWQQALSTLAEGRVDVCDMFPSLQRGKVYYFSNAIYNLRGIILLPAQGSAIGSYQDLQQRRVATVRGDFSQEYLSNRVDHIQFVLTADMMEAIELLRTGQVEAVVGDEPVISYYVDRSKLKEHFKMLDKPLYEEAVVFAVPKSEPELVNIINKGIFNIRKKSVLEKIQQKWFGISVPISQHRVSQNMLIAASAVVLVLMLILYGFYLWNEKLKAEVAKRTEELNLSRDDLQKTFDGIPYFMIVFDAELKVVNANRAFFRHTGWTAAELFSRNYRDIELLEDGEGLADMLKATFQDGEERNAEMEDKDRMYHVNTFPLVGKNKEVIKVVAAVRDVTESNMHARILLQESKMAAIGQLAAGIAHEIRNPLGLIRNYIYILKNELTLSNSRTEKAIQVIESSVERASGTISNLLNFSSISGEKSGWVEVGPLIISIIELEKEIIKKSNIQVEICCDAQVNCCINEESLKHILINLIANSVDAMAEGGILTVSCHSRENALEIRVEDTGGGIPPEYRDKIFEPFFTTKPPGKGTGLGLYIAYNEVLKYGGSIQAICDNEKGTVFEVMLPMARRTEQDE